MQDIIKKAIADHGKAVEAVILLTETIKQIASVCLSTLKDGGKIMLCGNGGSAADAQHLAAEFVGRFKKPRAPMPALALTSDTSILTAIGNDFGFEKIFSSQVSALGKPHDVLIVMSTSGNSKNIAAAVNTAKQQKITTVCLLGNDGGVLRDAGDINLIVPSPDTARVQETHILIGHILCEIIENEMYP